MLVVILFLIAAAFVYYFSINRLLGLPPGPPPLPFIGNMLSFQWEMDKVLLDWKARYGRIFTVWLPIPMVVIGDHQLLQQHVIKQGDNFLAKKIPEQLTKMMTGGLFGLVFEDNRMVKEQRSFARKSLHEIGFGSAALEDNVYNYAREVVNRWSESCNSTVDVSENIMKAVGNIVWSVTFGINIDFDNQIVPRFRKVQQEAIPLMAGPQIMFLEFFPALRKLDFLFGNSLKKLQLLIDETNAIVTDAIKKVEETFNADNQPNSYVEAFLREMKRNEEAQKPCGNFHFQQMQASAVSLWGAGFDTTVGMLRMCCLMLVNHPDVQRKLQKEIDGVIGKGRIRFEDREKLPYTCAFIQEVYRLGNVLPVMFLRQTTQATVIEGFPIPAGTSILPQFSMVHSDPAEFERPDFFCPERHIDEDGKFIKDTRITPFSIGRRTCLGETLARMEIFVIMTTIIQNCNFMPAGKVPPPVKYTYGFTRAVDQFLVNIEPRN